MKSHRYTHVSDVDEALGYLSSDVPYPDWLRIAMAVKAGLGEPGYAVLDRWSAGAANYNEAQNRVIYRGIKPGKITVATLFYEAKQRGWEPKNGAKKLLDSEISIDLDALQRNAKAAAPQPAELDKLDKSKAARAARQARKIIEAATLASDANPYLYRKKVRATDSMLEMDIDAIAGILKYTPKAKDELLTGRVLVLPVGRNGRLTTCELIDGKGRKTALPGPGTKKAAYWLTRPLPAGPGEDLTVLFGEGVATTCSALSGAPNALGVAVLTIGNFKPVIESFKARYPRAKLILLADLRKEPGLVPEGKALEVARETGALLAIPQFRSDRDPAKAKDFNDLFVIEGFESVQASIAAAERVEPLAPKLSRVERRTAQREPLLETYYGRAFPLLAVDEIRNRVQAALLSIIEEARKLAAVNARSEHKAYGPVLVLRLPTGIGKTMQMMRTLVEQGVRAAWYVPNHKLSAQSAKDFHRQAGTPPEVWNKVTVDLDDVPPFDIETLDYEGAMGTEPAARTLYGRQAEIDGSFACKRDKQLFRALKDKGLLPHASLILCGRKVEDEDGKKKFVTCPHFGECRFHVQMETQANVKILAHNYLFDESKVGSVALDGAQVVIIDESPFGMGFSHHTWSDSGHGEKLGKWLKHDFLVPVAESVLHGRVLSDDERAELLKKTKEAIQQIMEKIPEEKPPTAPDPWLIESIEKFKPPRQGELGMLVAAKHWLMGEENTLYREDFGPDSFALSSSLLRNPRALAGFTGPIIVLDATADENHYRQLFPGREVRFIGFDALPDPNVIWVQPHEGTFYRDLFNNQATDTAQRKRAIEELERIRQNLLGWRNLGAKTGLVSYDRVTHPLGEIEKSGVPMAHFGAVVGLNHLQDCNIGFGVGRTEPSARDCEQMARALFPKARDIRWNQDIKEFSFHGHLVDGTPYSEPHRAMRDPRVHSCLRMIREEASLIQGVEGRFRIFTPQEYPRVIVQLCALSRRERPPNVRAPAEAIIGTRRMAMVLAAFEGVAPLEPGVLFEKCPDQFESLKAAARWSETGVNHETKVMREFWLNPPFPTKKIISREWGICRNSELNENPSTLSINLPIFMFYYRIEGLAGKPKKALTNVHDMIQIIRQLETIHGERIVAIGLAADDLTPLSLEAESSTCPPPPAAATATAGADLGEFEGEDGVNEGEVGEMGAVGCVKNDDPRVKIDAPRVKIDAPPAAFSGKKSADERNAEQLAERFAAGTGNREIARETGISEPTVRRARAAWLATRPNCISYAPPSPKPSKRPAASVPDPVEGLDGLTDLAKAAWRLLKLAPAGLTLKELCGRLKTDGAAVASAVAELAGRQVVTRTREKVVRR